MKEKNTNDKKQEPKKPTPMAVMKNDLQNFMQRFGIKEIDFGSHKLKAKKK